MYYKRTSILMMLCAIAATILIFSCADDGGGGSNNGNGGAKGTNCDYGYSLENNECVLDIAGFWKFDTSNTCNNSSCTVFLSNTGTVSWYGDCAEKQQPYAPSRTDNYSIETVNGNPLGISFDGPGPQHDYTVEAGDGYLVLNPHSTSNLDTNRYLCPHTGLTSIMVNGAITTSASFTIAPSHDGTLYWAVYTDNATAPTAATLISAVKGGTAGVARSSATGIAVTAVDYAEFTISDLAEKTSYDLYAALEATVDGSVEQVLADKFDLATLCRNGFWLDGASNSCTAHGTLSASGWGVAANGVTKTCAGSSINAGDTYTIDGTTYTKRNKSDISTDNAADSCTSDITDMSELFKDNADFNGDIYHWDTSSVTNMSSMFEDASSFNQNISNWDVSSATNMSSMFEDASSFNQNISNWDVSSVTNMSGMFRVAKSFNADIGGWDVRNVSKSNMGNMFRSAEAFTHDISEWCVSHIDSVPNGFDTTTNSSTWPDENKPQWGNAQNDNCQVSFISQPTVGSKDATTATIQLTSSEDATLYWVLRTDTAAFADTTALKADIGTSGTIQDSGSDGADVSDESSYDIMLDNLSSQTTYYLYTALEVEVDGVLTESAVSDELKFVTVCNDGYGDVDGVCTELHNFMVSTNGIISCDGFDIGAAGIINDDESTVYVKRSREQILADVDLASTSCTSGITDMSSLFAETDFNGDIRHWDTSSVTNMYRMFYKTNDFVQDISNWDVSSVTNMEGMFLGRKANGSEGNNPNVSSWDTSSVENMTDMFKENGLFTGDISGWDVSNVTNMEGMFRVARSFNANISGWDVSMVSREKMKNMFRTASAFRQDISTWCVSHIGSKPEDFDTDTSDSDWPDTSQPQWGSTISANCN